MVKVLLHKTNQKRNQGGDVVAEWLKRRTFSDIYGLRPPTRLNYFDEITDMLAHPLNFAY